MKDNILKIVKRCVYCGGEIKSCNNFCSEEVLKKMEEKEIPKSENFNCIECGQVYDKYFKVMGLKLAWLKHKVEKN